MVAVVTEIFPTKPAEEAESTMVTSDECDFFFFSNTDTFPVTFGVKLNNNSPFKVKNQTS